jgi:hypothetical protein
MCDIRFIRGDPSPGNPFLKRSDTSATDAPSWKRGEWRYSAADTAAQNFTYPTPLPSPTNSVPAPPPTKERGRRSLEEQLDVTEGHR